VDVFATADAMGVFATSMEEVARGYRRIDDGGWTGDAGDNFRSITDTEPKRWLTAADAFGSARGALTNYAHVLTWAQNQGTEAAILYAQAQALTTTAKQDYQTQTQAYANTTSGSTSPPTFTDAGAAKRQQAQQMLADARNQVKAAGDDAERAIAAARDLAPQAPKLSFGDVLGATLTAMGNTVASTASSVVDGVASFGNAVLNNPGTVVTGIAGLALTAVSGLGEGAGIALDATGIGSVAGAPLNAVSAAGIATGVAMTVGSAADLAGHAGGDDKVGGNSAPANTDPNNLVPVDNDARPPGVPKDYSVGPARNGQGQVYRPLGQSAENDADSVRIMDPNKRYPNGYVRYYNHSGQPIDANGKPTGNDLTHLPKNPDGTYAQPKGWNSE
jgi:hypothetical protein